MTKAFSIGEKLRLMRTSWQVSNKEIANDTGIGQSSLSAYHHDRRNPSLWHLKLLCEFYGTNPCAFLHDVYIERRRRAQQ